MKLPRYIPSPMCASCGLPAPNSRRWGRFTLHNRCRLRTNVIIDAVAERHTTASLARRLGTSRDATAARLAELETAGTIRRVGGHWEPR